MEIDVPGIDLAKNVVQLHGAECSGRAVHRSKVRRGALIEAAQKLRSRLVAMGAWSSVDHLAHRLIGMGIEARLLSRQHVTLIVKKNKNDRNDAEANAVATSRPLMRSIAVKAIERQDIQVVHRVPSTLVPRCAVVIRYCVRSRAPNHRGVFPLFREMCRMA